MNSRLQTPHSYKPGRPLYYYHELYKEARDYCIYKFVKIIIQRQYTLPEKLLFRSNIPEAVEARALLFTFLCQYTEYNNSRRIAKLCGYTNHSHINYLLKEKLSDRLKHKLKLLEKIIKKFLSLKYYKSKEISYVNILAAFSDSPLFEQKFTFPPTSRRLS